MTESLLDDRDVVVLSDVPAMVEAALHNRREGKPIFRSWGSPQYEARPLIEHVLPALLELAEAMAPVAAGLDAGDAIGTAWAEYPETADLRRVEAALRRLDYRTGR